MACGCCHSVDKTTLLVVHPISEPVYEDRRWWGKHIAAAVQAYPGTRSLQYLICTNSMCMHWAYHVCRLFILRKTYCNMVQFKGLHLTFISLTAPSWFLCILSVSLLHTVPGPFVVEWLSGLLACSLNQKTSAQVKRLSGLISVYNPRANSDVKRIESSLFTSAKALEVLHLAETTITHVQAIKYIVFYITPGHLSLDNYSTYIGDGRKYIFVYIYIHQVPNII